MVGKRSRKQLKYARHTETMDSYESSDDTSSSLDRQNTYVLRTPAVPEKSKLDWRRHEDQGGFVSVFVFVFKASKQSGLKKSELLCYFLTKS